MLIFLFLLLFYLFININFFLCSVSYKWSYWLLLYSFGCIDSVQYLLGSLHATARAYVTYLAWWLVWRWSWGFRLFIWWFWSAWLWLKERWLFITIFKIFLSKALKIYIIVFHIEYTYPDFFRSTHGNFILLWSILYQRMWPTLVKVQFITTCIPMLFVLSLTTLSIDIQWSIACLSDTIFNLVAVFLPRYRLLDLYIIALLMTDLIIWFDMMRCIVIEIIWLVRLGAHWYVEFCFLAMLLSLLRKCETLVFFKLFIVARQHDVYWVVFA